MKALRIAGRVLIYTAVVVLVSLLLIAASGADPIKTLGIFWNGIFGNKNSFCEIFVKGTPLILTGLACALAFRTGFFNNPDISFKICKIGRKY